MDDEIKVRVGTPEDMAGVMHLASIVGQENAVFPLNEQKVAKKFWAALNQLGGTVFVIGPPERLEAMALVELSEYWYSDQPFLEEICVFVHPEYRAAKGGRARKLCEAIKRVREKLDMPLMIGVLSNSRTDGKVKLYERQFGAPAGAFFLVGASTGLAEPDPADTPVQAAVN